MKYGGGNLMIWVGEGGGGGFPGLHTEYHMTGVLFGDTPGGTCLKIVSMENQ